MPWPRRGAVRKPFCWGATEPGMSRPEVHEVAAVERDLLHGALVDDLCRPTWSSSRSRAPRRRRHLLGQAARRSCARSARRPARPRAGGPYAPRPGSRSCRPRAGRRREGARRSGSRPGDPRRRTAPHPWPGCARVIEAPGSASALLVRDAAAQGRAGLGQGRRGQKEDGEERPEEHGSSLEAHEGLLRAGIGAAWGDGDGLREAMQPLER